MPATLVLLAAGMGSRFGSLKQLEPFGPTGEALMDYAVHDALRAGIRRVVFVIRRDFEDQFRSQVLARYEKRASCALAFQALDDLPEGRRVPDGRLKPWGTGHAVLAARGILNGPFAVCNADDFYGAAAYGAMAAWLKAAPAKGECALVGYRLGDTLSPHGTVSRGVCESQGAWLSKVVERKAIGREGGRAVAREGGAVLELSEDAAVSMNFWGFSPDMPGILGRAFEGFLASLKDPLKDEFLLPEVVNSLLAGGQAKARLLAGGERWFGVTYPEDREAVRASLRALCDAGLYPSPLF